MRFLSENHFTLFGMRADENVKYIIRDDQIVIIPDYNLATSSNISDDTSGLGKIYLTNARCSCAQTVSRIEIVIPLGNAMLPSHLPKS